MCNFAKFLTFSKSRNLVQIKLLLYIKIIFSTKLELFKDCNAKHLSKKSHLNEKLQFLELIDFSKCICSPCHTLYYYIFIHVHKGMSVNSCFVSFSKGAQLGKHSDQAMYPSRMNETTSMIILYGIFSVLCLLYIRTFGILFSITMHTVK